MEVAIVLAILTIATYPAIAMFEQLNRSYRRAIAISDLKTQTLGAVAKIRAAGIGGAPIKIDPDQRGATIAASKVRWTEQTVLLERNGHSAPILENVRHFSLHRRDGVVYLTVELQSSGREVFDYRSVTTLSGKSQ